MIPTPIRKTFQYGKHSVTLETGEIARQADGAVLVNMDDTVVLVTVVARKEADTGRDFFPLTVDYQEKTYAAGKIPGGFFRREGRPSEKEILTSRLIDRPIRPLFPKGFVNEVQVIITVKSLNPEVDPEIPSLIGTSAALAISGLPFNGPVGAARVGYKDGEYLLNHSETGIGGSSELDLIVAGTEHAVLMVESEANELSEEIMLGAVLFGHEQSRTVIDAIRDLAAEVNKEPLSWTPPESSDELIDHVTAEAENAVIEAYGIADKMQRYGRLDAIKADLVQKLCAIDDSKWSEQEIEAAVLISEADGRTGADRLDQRADRQPGIPDEADCRRLVLVDVIGVDGVVNDGLARGDGLPVGRPCQAGAEPEQHVQVGILDDDDRKLATTGRLVITHIDLEPHARHDV